MTPEIASQLCDAAERALGLESIIRYRGKNFFAAETARFEAAHAIEGTPRLESVADHCWHLGYLAMLLLPYLPDLDRARVHDLIVLHDILELITGDADPTGTDGTNGHAFNADLARAKETAERAALEDYLAPLPAAVAAQHRTVLEEELACISPEAKFLKVLDKLQCLFFFAVIKQRPYQEAAMDFFRAQRDKVLPLCPELTEFYNETLRRREIPANELAA